MTYIEISNVDYGFGDALKLKDKGKDLHDQYVNNDPFPHIVIDNFVSPAVLEACLEDFPRSADPDSQSFDRAQERYKTSFNPDYLSPRVRSFFYSLNSRPFIEFLENMTGIKGLLPDPHFVGGGFHQTTEGGHLGVHADFNYHPLLKVQRRLNLLIYLNKDWKLEYGGALELWDKPMQNCVKRVEPEFNRCVVFSTNATSWHGHPVPVQHPRKTPRRSLALYYYTSSWDGTERAFTTQFRRRKETTDKTDWQVKGNELLDDLMPPLLTRQIRKVAHRLKWPAKKDA